MFDRRLIPVFLLSATLGAAPVGCEKNVAVPEAPDDALGAGIKPVAEAPEVQDDKAPAKSALEEADVQALVDAWLAAQNASEFDKYAASYGPRFTGVKRSGAKSSTFDRKGWLEDRARMFKKKMEVKADGVEIVLAAQSAIVRFEQTWASGTYRDVGPKQLVVVPTAEGLKIVREEMVRSTIVGADGSVPDYRPEELALMVGPDFIVLDLDDSMAVTENRRVVQVDGTAQADVIGPDDLTSKWIGKSVRVYLGRKSPDSKVGGEVVCEARVASLHVLARVTPHFGQVSYWKGDETGGVSELTQDEIAQEIWSLAGESRVVVGKLDKACGGGVRAHVVDAVIEPGVIALNPDAELRAKAVEAFRTLPGHREIQKEYTSMSETDKPWDEVITTTVQAFRSGAAGGEFVSVGAQGGERCGGFWGEFWAIYQIGPNGELTLMTDGKAPGEYFEPRGATQIEGQIAFISRDSIVRKVGAVWRSVHQAEVPYYDCPC